MGRREGDSSEGHEDQYQMVRPIGSGSFGQVFLVLHKKERKEYVMKTIELQSASDEGRQSTELEVKLLSTMQHPNIVAYHDSFMDSAGQLCILMEYCEHGDIFTYLQEARRSHSAPDEPRLMEWFTQIVLALQSLHQKKILHRDLKTQNIFLTGDRQQGIFSAKLGDFGIAKVLNSTIDLAQTQIGTPFYMSPELINNKPYSYKSDVWGLGCVLYEIVNGQRAFDAQSLNGLALKIIKGSYSPISASCSQPTKLLIKSMLSKSHVHRPSLKEILHMPSIRPRIPLAQRSAMAAGPAETRAWVEQTLNDQLASLGLGRLVNAPAVRGPQSEKDKKRLLQRLERAEQRKRREEKVLQHSVALLEKVLRDPAVSAEESGGAHAGVPRAPVRAPPLPSPPEPRWVAQCSDESQEETMMPVLSHRDRATRQKERRRDDVELRFEEVKKNREHQTHQQRAARTGEKKHRSTSMGIEEPPPALRPPRPRARTEDAVSLEQGGAVLSSVSWLLEYDHVEPENLAQPFQQNRQHVVHSPLAVHKPRARHQTSSDPTPPRHTYGPQPLPPNASPPAASGARSWRTAEGPWRASQPARPSLHNVFLEALEPKTCPSESEGDEDLFSSDSEFGKGISEADEGQTARQRGLQQRIDESKAAICKYRMTIDMLQFSFEHVEGQDGGITEQRATARHRTFQPTEANATGGLELEARRGPGLPAPSVVQDCAARLLRRCLEGLGSDMLQAARRVLLQDSSDELPSRGGSLRQRMLELLGAEKIGFLSLVDQLVHMESRWILQDPG